MKEQKYQVHYDEDNKAYWIGSIVRYHNGSSAFVQQVGHDYQRKIVAERVASALNAKEI